MADNNSATATSNKTNILYFVHALICLALMFGIGQLPPLQPLTPLGMNLIGIFSAYSTDGYSSTSCGRASPDCWHSCSSAA